MKTEIKRSSDRNAPRASIAPRQTCPTLLGFAFTTIEWIFFITAILTGTFFRLYLLSTQILVNDEWHGVYFVSTSPFSFILTHFSVPGVTLHTHQYIHGPVTEKCGMERMADSTAVHYFGSVDPVLIPWAVRSSSPNPWSFCLPSCSRFRHSSSFYTRMARPYAPFCLLSFLVVCFSATDGWRRDEGAIALPIWVLPCFPSIFILYAFRRPLPRFCAGLASGGFPTGPLPEVAKLSVLSDSRLAFWLCSVCFGICGFDPSRAVVCIG